MVVKVPLLTTVHACHPCFYYQTGLLLHKTKLPEARKLGFLHLTHSRSLEAQADSSASTENSHTALISTALPVPSTAHDAYEGTRPKGEASSQGQTRSTAQTPVSAWHLLRWPPGRVPKLRQYLMLFFL